MKITHLFYLLVIALSLTACGGGGGSESPNKASVASPSPPPVPPPVFSMSATSQTDEVDELTSGSATFAFAGIVGKVTLSARLINDSLNSDIFSVSTDDLRQTVTLTLKEVAEDIIIEVFVVATNGNGTTATKMVTFTAINVSARKTLAQLLILQQNLDNLSNLTQERRILSTLFELAFFTGTIGSDEMASRKREIDLVIWPDGINASRSTIESILQNANFEDDYLNRKVVDEIWLKEQLVTVMAAQKTLSEPINALLIETQLLLGDSIIAPLSIGEYFFDPQTKTVSQFHGNPELGQYVDGQWRYNEAQAYLAHLVEPQNLSYNQ